MPLPPMLRPHCGIWAEPGRVEIMFRLDGLTSYQHIIVEVPPKDGSLPEVKGEGTDTIPLLAKISQAAQLCGFKPKTFYNWLETGKLPERTRTSPHRDANTGSTGALFKACVDRGEFASCS